jgi:two-component system sensor kinase FixL
MKKGETAKLTKPQSSAATASLSTAAMDDPGLVSRGRQTGLSVRVSEERLRAIIDQAIVGIVQSDLNGHITFANGHFCELTGYPLKELLGKRWQDFTHPDDLPQNIAFFEQIMREDKPFSFEKRYICKNGETVWVSVGASMLYSADGEVVGGLAVVVDISKRKRAEDSLKRSSEEIADLYNHAPCGYHSLDRDGVFRQINDTELAWLGYTREEMVGKMKVTDLMTPASREIFRETFPRFMQQGMVRDLEFEMIRRDGTVFAALVNATAIYDSGGAYVMSRSTITDISVLKQTEAELRKSEARTHMAISASRMALWDYDLVTGTVYLSEGWSQLLDGGQKPTFTTIQELTELVPEEERSMVRAALLSAAKGLGSSSYQFAHRVRKPDGEYIWVLSEGYVTDRSVDGRALRMIGTNRDITERKKLEKEVLERRNEMDELQKLHVAAQTAAAIAHELNQPLLAIASYSEAALILLQSGKPDLAKIRKAIEAGERQAHRAGQSLREMLEFLSMNEFPSEAFDLNREILDLIEMARSEHELQFQTVLHLEQGLPLVQANYIHVQKVLLNLLRNGIEAMQQAGMPQPAISVTVRTIRDRSLAQVTLRDNGPGLSDDDMQRLFQPFFSTKAGGIGMGLAISRSLIEANGGQLWFDPQEGPGATFHLTLPLAP